MSIDGYLSLIVVIFTGITALLIFSNSRNQRRVFDQQNNINHVQHLRIVALEARLKAAGIPPVEIDVDADVERDGHAVH